jgi:hypothetical protein
MNRAILLFFVASIAVMMMTNCGGVVTDFEEIYVEANQHEQVQAQLEEKAEKEKQTQLEKQAQLEKQLIAQRQEEFRQKAHLGEWYFDTDYATIVLLILENNRWSMYGGHFEYISGNWNGDAAKINFFTGSYNYHAASARVVESGVLEFTNLNQGTHQRFATGAIRGTAHLKRK